MRSSPRPRSTHKLPNKFGLFNTHICYLCVFLRNFYGGVQRTGAGSNPHSSRVVSMSDRDHGTATTDNRTLGLMPAGTISHSNLSLGLFPLLICTFVGCKQFYPVLQVWVGIGVPQKDPPFSHFVAPLPVINDQSLSLNHGSPYSSNSLYNNLSKNNVLHIPQL